jgi:dTDP-4-dehydrorhamnose 3,5-epimerase-like enzyme
MKRTQLAIKDIVLIEPKVFPDNRGYLYESYNAKYWKKLSSKTCKLC